MTHEVNTAMKLKDSEGLYSHMKEHFTHVNNFKSTISIRQFY